MLRTAVVDDHKLFRKGLSRLISGFDGVEVVLEAENGRDLLEQLKAVTIDFLLIDLQMPELDGIETTRRIRDIEHKEGRRAVPIIGITAHVMEQDRDRGLAAGMNEYITKPFEPATFLETIRAVCAAAKRHTA